MKQLFEKLGGMLVKKPKTVMACVLLISVICAFGLPKIEMKMGNDVFVASDSAVYKNTELYKKQFGGDNEYILIKAKKGSAITHEQFQKIATLEEKIGQAKHVTQTTSILSLLNEELQKSGATQLSGQSGQTAAQQAKVQKDIQANLSTKDKAAIQQKVQQLLTTEQQQKVSSYTQSLLSTQQLQTLAAQGAAANAQSVLTKAQQTQVQTYMQSLLTSAQQTTVSNETIKRLPAVEKMTTALLQDLLMTDGKVNDSVSDLLPKNGRFVLMMASLDNTDMDTYTEATADIQKILKNATTTGLTVKLAGQPVVTGEIQGEVSKTMAVMLAISVVLMVVILAVIFPVRRRLFSLLFVLIGLIWAFGLMGWFHIALTLATMATLPILIGLGTDFGVQFQNRYEEEYRKRNDHEQAVRNAIGSMGPAVGTALIVMIFAFLTMYLSKAPMMQQFGLTLAIGVVAVYVVEVLMMFATLALCDRKNPSLKEQHAKTSWISKGLKHYAEFVTKHAKLVLAIGVVLGAAGFFVEHKIPVETNMMKMIPQDMQALKDTNYLQKQVGSTTYITYLVKADDVTDQATLEEIQAFADQENQRYQDVLGATTLLSTYQKMSGQTKETQASLSEGLVNLSTSVKSSYLTKTQTYTQIQFKIDSRLSTAQQNKLLKKMNQDAKAYSFKQVKSIVPAGSQVLMLTAIDNMSSNRELMMFAGLVAIVLVLFLVYRKVRYALLPALPIIAVLGLSPLTLYLLNTSYNPLTLGLSALVLGIGTEFTILILERYREEVERGIPVRQAVIDAVQSVGQAITVSGLTVVGGFAAIIFVSFPVLSSFGLITVLDTAYSLLAALTLLPAIIVLTQKDKRKE